jgi:hypothetical protein
MVAARRRFPRRRLRRVRHPQSRPSARWSARRSRRRGSLKAVASVQIRSGLQRKSQVRGLAVGHGSRALIICPSFVRRFCRHLATSDTRKKFSSAPWGAQSRAGVNTREEMACAISMFLLRVSGICTGVSPRPASRTVPPPPPRAATAVARWNRRRCRRRRGTGSAGVGNSRRVWRIPRTVLTPC